MPLTHRRATAADEAALRDLVALARPSAAGVPDAGPSAHQPWLHGLDTLLIADGTYFLVRRRGLLAGCGGWSRRATPYGHDHSAGRDDRLLDPLTAPARIRAMYTHPDHARRGVGRMILDLSERAAKAAGFGRLELSSTHSGAPLYEACGFRPVARFQKAGVPLILMQRNLILRAIIHAQSVTGRCLDFRLQQPQPSSKAHSRPREEIPQAKNGPVDCAGRSRAGEGGRRVESACPLCSPSRRRGARRAGLMDAAFFSQWLPPIVAMLGAGLLAGFAAGLFGIGGGFVVVPALFVVLPMLGSDAAHLAHAAIGTSLATIVVTSLRSVQAHARRGAVDFDVLKSWAPWIVLGVGGGILLADRVSSHGLALIFGGGVLLMATHFLFPLLAGKQFWDDMPGGYARAGIAGGLGAFSSLLGIGGGTIAIIVMTLCGKSIHRSIATASGMGAIIALPGMIGFMAIGLHEPGLPVGSVGYVNLPAAIAITSTSVLTAPLGAAAAHKLNPKMLRTTFGLYLLFVAFTMIQKGLH